MESKAKLLKEKPEEKLSIALSVSKVKTFKDCKAKFKFGYIEKLPRKDWDFHIFGKFLHEVLESFYKQRLSGSSELDNVLMGQCFKGASNNWRGKISIEQKKESWEMLNKYLQQLAEQRLNDALPKVVGVEENFFINIDDKILLNGFIDRVQYDPDGILHVADYKTSKSKKYLEKDHFQLMTYAYVKCLQDPNLEKIRTSYILLRHGFESIVKEYKRSAVMKIEKKFLDYAEKIEKEKLWRPNPTILCNFCDYIDVCDAGKKFAEEGDLTKFGVLDW